MREFQIERDPNGCGVLYYRSKVKFEPGVTVLIGCNGCGKTTMMKQIKNELKKEGIPFIHYDNLKDGNYMAREKAGLEGDFHFLATSILSSEGENIVMNMGNIAKKMGELSRNNPDAKEQWFLFDAIDSGLSIDNVRDIKKYLFKTVFECNKNKDIYIIVTANEYEVCRGEKCFDTYLCKYVEVDSYEKYADFIMKSRERKDKRYDD